MTNDHPVAPPKKILVVDDTLVIRKVVEMKLKASGYRVMGAVDASAAISAIKQEIPDLILLDLLFPPDPMDVGMHWDGFAIIRWVHNMSGAQDVPIIIISGTDPAKYRDRCLAAGAAAYLHKPLNMDELLAAIHRVLGENVASAT
jgi:DNA-binding response OmpR family regulator